MTSAEKAKYLANIFSIATADGKVAPEESEVLQLIIDRIGADADVVEKARRMIVGGRFRLQGLARSSDRAQNIEDMVMVAMADGELQETETVPIEKLSDLLKMSQKDMDNIVNRVQRRLKSQLKSGRSDHVTRKHAAPAKKKTRVRKQVDEARQATVKPESVEPQRQVKTPKPAPAVPKKFEPAAEGITISFQGAVGGTLHRLKSELGKAMKSGEFVESGRTWYYGTWKSDSISDAGQLAMRVFRLPRREAYVDGEKIEWDDLFGFCSCAYQRATAADLDTYCFGSGEPAINIWGCKKAKMEWSEYADWFSEGRMGEKNKFFFDKDAIARRLEKAMRRFCYCPYINSRYAEAVLNRFPDSVHVWGHWKYRETDSKTPGAELRTIREQSNGCSFSYDAFVDGIVPTDNSEAKRLIRLASRDSGLGNIDVTG